MSEATSIFATPRAVRFDDCTFYHVMDLPGVGRVGGEWDLRSGVRYYLGCIELNGKRVLEIGPASGFLTVEMERAGAIVTAVEVPDSPGWDFVPYPPCVLEPIQSQRAEHMRRIKNSFWFTHSVSRSNSRLIYCDVYDLPPVLGQFDVAVMGSVLLHTRNPLAIMEQCSKRAKTLVITEVFRPDLEGRPVCRLLPTKENNLWDTWWEFSTDYLKQFAEVLGFRSITVTKHYQVAGAKPVELFTIVASEQYGA